jgi:diacylglycerol kinase (ATP)
VPGIGRPTLGNAVIFEFPDRCQGKEFGVLVLTNELAGRTEQDAVALAVAVLETVATVEVVTCTDQPDLDPLLDRRGDRPLVVVGGDGSLHTTLRALWRRGEADTCPVGLIPLGTGNDFARGVGIPLDAAEAANVIVTGEPTPLDLATDDRGDVVVNAMHVGAGADAAVRARPLKPYLRIAAFPLGAVLAGLRSSGLRLRVEVDGRPVVTRRRKVLMAGLANGPSIAGGTAELAPGASARDGRLDVVVSFAVGPLARAGYALALLRGTHAKREDVVRRLARTVRITGEPFYANTDGEITGPHTHREWTVRPAAWRCYLPALDAARTQFST